MPSKKELICTLLKGIETGDPKSVEVVDEKQYIQHNPLTKTGNAGLAELFERLSKTNPRVEIVRTFEDGDFVFAHTDYDFNVREVGFEVFRFENDRVVEHWDNLQLKSEKPNPSGRTMLDGSTRSSGLEKTEKNRQLGKSFIQTVLIEGYSDRIDFFVCKNNYLEHNPEMRDGLSALSEELSKNTRQREYRTLHRVLAEGNFVLCVTEGSLGQEHVSFYDLFRIDDGKIVEHWDTVDEVPPPEQWVNNNGKF